MDKRSLGILVKEIGSSTIPLKAIEKYTMANWQNGHCWLFAVALQDLLGYGELWAVSFLEDGKEVTSHVLLKIDTDSFLDSNGEQNSLTAIKRHDEWYGESLGSYLKPLKLCNTSHINPLPTKDCIQDLVRAMEEMEYIFKNDLISTECVIC